MNKEETPISKYIASLERRQALLSPSPTQEPGAIIRRINFEDTYCQGVRGDQSILLAGTPSPDVRPMAKKRRLSILEESMEDVENQNKKLSVLERLLQQTQGELIESRALNTKLEHQICQIKSANGARLLGFERSENEMRTRMREASDQVVLLKEQVNKLTKKEEELLEKMHKQTEMHCEKMKSIEDKLRVLETENLELRGKFESGTLKQTDELRKLNASLEETEIGAEKWVMETQLLRDQLELKDKQLKKYQNDLKEAQLITGEYNELKAKYNYPQNPDGTSENLEEKIKYFENLYVRQQGENIKLLQRMEKIDEENKMLRSTMDKEMLLEEQISTFEEEVKSLRASLEGKAVIEAEKGALESELSSWTTMAYKLDPDCTNPMRFESYIRKLQNQLLEAKHESSTLKLTITDKDRYIARNQGEIKALQEQVAGLSTEKENLTQELKKTTRRLVLVTKDRDGLKDLKESYEQEFEGVISKPLQHRINQLEATVAEYETMIQEDPSSKKSCGDCEKRMALISEIRAEMDRLKSDKAQMESQLSNMSVSVAEGDTTGVKIVTFGMNPSQLPTEERLKEAVKEIEELKEKIKQLEERTVDESSMGLGDSETLKELQEQNKNLERRLAILGEAYDFETQQLQIIVNKLFGFHFTLVREPTVQTRLSSVYSHEPNDHFIFQESPNGDMLLLESPILNNFREDIDRFLIRDGSIPGFLASVIISYLQSQSETTDASQLPASQQSVAEDETSNTASVSGPRDPREVQVEVTRQRHPTVNEPDEEEDGEDLEDEAEEEEYDDVEDEELEQDDNEMEEEGRYEDEEEHEDDEDVEDEEEDDDPESPPAQVRRGPPPSARRGPPPQFMRAPPRPPTPDSDDSDVIMIDDD